MVKEAISRSLEKGKTALLKEGYEKGLKEGEEKGKTAE
jgi:flagellar biosynthesis/type III secretory pathway protein FliH